MVEVYSVIGFMVGVLFISISLLRLKKQNITQGVFTLWIIIGTTLIIIASFPLAIFTIQRLIGTQFVLSAVFGIPIVILTILVFHLHLKVDALNKDIVKLISKLAVKEYFQPSDKKEE